MAQGIEARTLLAQLSEGFLPPIRLVQVRAAWSLALARVPACSETPPRVTLQAFIETFLAEQKARADVQELVRILAPALASMRGTPDLNVEQLVGAANGAYESDPVDTSAVRETTVRTFSRMNSSQEDRRNLSHSLVACRRVGDFLKSLRNAVEQLVLDPATLPSLKSAAERERFVKLACVDLDTDLEYLGTLRAELVALDTRLSECREDLHKVMTALRMLTELGGQNLRLNGSQSLSPPAMPPFSHSAQRTVRHG